jgi:hypothetical protein
MCLARLSWLALLLALTSPTVASQPPATTPEWVARQIDERNTGRDSRLDMTMRLFDRQDRVRERSLVVLGLEANTTRGDRILVRFFSPNDIKGTALLVWEHPSADDERFLYLPALGRVRRIAGSEQQESFVGSDLSYEDIGGCELSDYTYRFVDAEDFWEDGAGGKHPAWRLESRAVDQQSSYPRTESLVRKDNFVVMSASVFNRRNVREKLYEVRRLEQIDGVWTAMDVVMRNDLQKTRTELIVTQARYNAGLTEAAFSRRALEQGEP